MKKLDFSKVAVVFLFFLLIVFTAIVLNIFAKTGQEPTELVRCVYGTLFGELGLLAWIKKTKVQSGGEVNDESG